MTLDWGIATFVVACISFVLGLILSVVAYGRPGYSLGLADNPDITAIFVIPWITMLVGTGFMGGVWAVALLVSLLIAGLNEKMPGAGNVTVILLGMWVAAVILASIHWVYRKVS